MESLYSFPLHLLAFPQRKDAVHFKKHLSKQISWGASSVREAHSLMSHLILLSFWRCQPPNNAVSTQYPRKGLPGDHSPPSPPAKTSSPPLLPGLMPRILGGKRNLLITPLLQLQAPLHCAADFSEANVPHIRANPSDGLSPPGPTPRTTLYFFTPSFFPYPGMLSSRIVLPLIICKLTSIIRTF